MSKPVLSDSRQDLVDLVKRKNELAVSCSYLQLIVMIINIIMIINHNHND